MEINKFVGNDFYLSNFYPCKINYLGVEFNSTEAAFQAAKCKNLQGFKSFSGLNPTEAKRKGRRISLRDDWEEVKLSVMKEILILKFQDKELKEKLLNTGNATLIEGNNWNDCYWGVCNGIGENHLGKLLMEIRESMKI